MAVKQREIARTQVRPGLRVRRIPDWEAAGLAGLLGGLTFLILEMVLTPLIGGGSVWDAPRLVASVVFGETLAVPADSFVLTIALFVHFTLSLVYARVFALLTYRSAWNSVVLGAAFGLALYFVNFYGIGAFNERLAEARSLTWLLSHVGFGAVVGGAYRRLERVQYE